MGSKGFGQAGRAAGMIGLSSKNSPIPQALVNSAFTVFRIGGRRKASGAPPFLPGGGNLDSIATQKQSWPRFAYGFSVTPLMEHQLSWTPFSDSQLPI